MFVFLNGGGGGGDKIQKIWGTFLPKIYFNEEPVHSLDGDVVFTEEISNGQTEDKVRHIHDG